MGSSNKRKEKDDKDKCIIEPSASSETESASKKMKKHKHKRLKERSKREKSKSTVASQDLDEDMELGDNSQQGQHHLDGTLPSYSADSLGTWEEDEDGGQMSGVIKTKKSKKKDKNKDRDLLKASKKDKKNSKKDGKADSDGKIERKEARPEKKNTGKDDGTDSEEERWLHAIEAGKLEEVDDELKRIRNPRLLTARQRALLEKQRPGDLSDPSLILMPGEDVAQQQQLLHQQETDQQCPILIPAEPLLALPSGVREKQVTQEMLEKKAIKSQRRRAQALEKREEDKKKTVDRLLKKQDSKLMKACFSKKSIKSEVLMFSYRSTSEGALLSLPTGVDYPIKHQQSPPIPQPKLCGIPGCTNPKRYSCSKSGVPLCSLQCYKVNKTRVDMALPAPVTVSFVC